MVRMLFRVDYERCQVCLRCLAAEACRQRAIVKVDSDEPPYVEADRCRDCRQCIPACPFAAIVEAR